VYVTARLAIIPPWNKIREKLQTLEELAVWRHRMYFLLFTSGCCWGAIGLMSPHGGTTVQILTALIVSVMAAGAMILYVSSRLAMAVVVLPTMLGWGLGYVISGQEHNILVGSIILLYGGLMIVLGKHLHGSISTLFVLDNILQKSEERVRLAMASSDAKTWDWDLTDDSMYCEGNVDLIQGHAHLKAMLLEFLETGSDIDSEMNVAPAGEPPKYLAFRGKIYRNRHGKAYRCTGIVWDITIKKSQEMLRRELDLHEASNNAKSVLLANASHEIRTPLAAILGFAEALLVKQQLDEESRNDVHAIHRQGKFMTSLVNDLLDLSKLESNKLYIQKAPMSPACEIADSMTVLRSVLGPDHTITVTYDTLVPSEIQMDSVRFRQILNNLMSNAIKFTPRGHIELRVKFFTDANGESTLSIVVADTGIGMDEETQRNLFQPFVRGESEYVQKVSGSGLGLALSQRLALLLGGNISLIYSELNKGSTFEFTLKVGKLADLRLRVAQKEPESEADLPQLAIERKLSFLNGRRVLVVDDSEDLRLLMNRYLLRQGAEVEVCENGAEALSKAQAQLFDVILMDIKMPIMDGHEAVMRLRESGYQRPIVALTAQASTEGKNKCLASGFDGYLSKPIDISVLEEILASTVRT
ncbi:MAG: response regulator, partial [Bdellovibrio sp.]|nr:response regulator [Bdellovibrio sp.]